MVKINQFSLHTEFQTQFVVMTYSTLKGDTGTDTEAETDTEKEIRTQHERCAKCTVDNSSVFNGYMYTTELTPATPPLS